MGNIGNEARNTFGKSGRRLSRTRKNLRECCRDVQNCLDPKLPLGQNYIVAVQGGQLGSTKNRGVLFQIRSQMVPGAYNFGLSKFPYLLGRHHLAAYTESVNSDLWSSMFNAGNVWFFFGKIQLTAIFFCRW